MTELRLGWLLLGMLLAVTSRPATPAFAGIAALPWILGATGMGGPRGEQIVEVLRALLRDGAARVALIVLAAIIAATGLAFGAFAGLLALTWFSLGVLTLAHYGREGSARSLLIGGALAGAALTLGVWLSEAILRMPRLAQTLGTPAAREAWEAAYDSTWARNVFGFRSPHERVARTAGTARVIAIGDSYTWGDKLPSADGAWPAQVEQRLRAGGRRVEVINMGQRGFTLANEGEQLRRLGWQFSPDVVVWQYFVNDAYRSWPNFGRDGEAWVGILPARFRVGYAGRSALLYLAERGVNQALRGRDGATAYASLYADSSEGWRQLDAALAEAADSARARGVPIVLVLFPAFVPGEWTAEDYPLRDQYAQVRRAAEGRGLAVLDLVPLFGAKGGNWRQWWALPWDSHPSAQAQSLAADTIAAFLGERGLLPAATSTP